MCGINGCTWGDVTLVEKMNSTTKHRGPDDEGVFSNDDITLGNLRLAIIDLSPAGHQPMSYRRGDREVWITYNGEIYNFEEIRASLLAKGYSFHSRSDTEMILAAYIEWGTECVRRFNGMWAFAIYDVNDGTLFLSRDRFGIKPLYYNVDERGLSFSSEIKGLAVAGAVRSPNERMIFDFLYFGNADHTEETFFEGIRRLLPSCNLVYDLRRRTMRFERYFDVDDALVSGGPRHDAAEFRETLEAAVRRHLVSDVPVGSCLSGGTDSSALVCAMRIAEPTALIKTFSLVFPGTKIDESRYQKLVSELCRTDAHETTFGPDDLLRDLSDFIYTQEEPFSSLSPYGQYKVMELAHSAGMKVLLDGQGSDELLGGYHTYFPYLYYELLTEAKPLELLKAIFSYARAQGTARPAARLAVMLLPDSLQRSLNFRRRGYLSREFYGRYRSSLPDRFRPKKLNRELVDTLVKYSLPHLLRLEDKNSMRWSIESRVPFLDLQFALLCISSPSEQKVSGSTTKVILRKALEGLVPPEILNRKDKVGFRTPDSEVASSPVARKLIAEILESQTFRERPYWDWRKVKSMYEEDIASGRPSRFGSDEIWKIVILELWLRMWFDDAHLEPPPAPVPKPRRN